MHARAPHLIRLLIAINFVPFSLILYSEKIGSDIKITRNPFLLTFKASK
jgi:hypothetical protein